MHTGDKGYYDADGNVFVIGRFKELIKYRMAHVSNAATLPVVPKVLECCFIFSTT